MLKVSGNHQQNANLLERVERDQSEVRFIGVDAARPEILVEQLGTFRSVRTRLATRRLGVEGPPERRRPRRWAGTAATASSPAAAGAAAAAHSSRGRAQRLHREVDGGLVDGSGLGAGVGRRFVTERPPSQRRRDNTRHQWHTFAIDDRPFVSVSQCHSKLSLVRKKSLVTYSV